MSISGAGLSVAFCVGKTDEQCLCRYGWSFAIEHTTNAQIRKKALIDNDGLRFDAGLFCSLTCSLRKE